MSLAGFSDGETKLLASMIRHLKDNTINTDWDRVAVDLGYKDASIAKTRWSQIRRKKIDEPKSGAKRKGSEQGDEATPVKKRRASSKKAAPVASIEQDDEEGMDVKKAVKAAKETIKEEVGSDDE